MGVWSYKKMTCLDQNSTFRGRGFVANRAQEMLELKLDVDGPRNARHANEKYILHSRRCVHACVYLKRVSLSVDMLPEFRGDIAFIVL